VEAIVELIAAFVGAFVHAVAGLLWAIGALLAAVVEFLFLALTQGFSSASQKYIQRKIERRSRLAATESEADAKATERTPSISRKQTAIIVALVLLVIISGVAVGLIRDRIRKQRIAATRVQVAELADSFAEQIENEEVADSEPGRLREYDAWKQPFELFIDKALLGSLIVVRSPGPDRESGSIDDILAVRVVRASAKEVGGELANRALEAMRNRVDRLFAGDDGEVLPKDIDIGER